MKTPKWLPETCTGRQLGQLLGISDRSVREWAVRGVIVRGADYGSYRTMESIHGYLAEMEKIRPDDHESLTKVKVETQRIDRQIKEIKLAQLRGDVLTLDECAEAWTKFSSAINAVVVSLPGRARAELAHLTDHDERTLSVLVQDLLLDFARRAEQLPGVPDTQEFGVLPDSPATSKATE